MRCAEREEQPDEDALEHRAEAKAHPNSHQGCRLDTQGEIKIGGSGKKKGGRNALLIDWVTLHKSGKMRTGQTNSPGEM